MIAQARYLKNVIYDNVPPRQRYGALKGIPKDLAKFWGFWARTKGPPRQGTPLVVDSGVFRVFLGSKSTGTAVAKKWNGKIFILSNF